jgi:hypothetical protein
MDHPLGSRVLRSEISLHLNSTKSTAQLERCLKHKVFVYDVCESAQFNVCLAILEAQVMGKHTNSTYSNWYSGSAFLYSCGRTCGMLHQLYVPYGVPVGSVELLKMKPWTPVRLITSFKLVTQVLLGACQARLTEELTVIDEGQNDWDGAITGDGKPNRYVVKLYRRADKAQRTTAARERAWCIFQCQYCTLSAGDRIRLKSEQHVNGSDFLFGHSRSALVYIPKPNHIFTPQPLFF